MRQIIIFHALLQLFSASRLKAEDAPITDREFLGKLGLRTRLDLQKNARIVGGRVAEEGRYNYQTSLTWQDDTLLYPFCGGTLIAPGWVLSAAHCYGLATHVEIGHHNLTDRAASFDLIEVEREIRHPRYDDTTFNFDAMLVKLKTPSSYQPVQLDDGELFDGDKSPEDGTFTLMGWGTTSYGGDVSNVLREVNVDLFPWKKCNIRYLGGLTKNMVCAMGPGKDACQGDSGGPMIVKGETAAHDVQVGIVSWGVGCASQRYPGVYTKVSSLMPFLKRHVDFSEVSNATSPETASSFEEEILESTGSGYIKFVEQDSATTTSIDTATESNNNTLASPEATLEVNTNKTLDSQSTNNNSTNDMNDPTEDNEDITDALFDHTESANMESSSSSNNFSSEVSPVLQNKESNLDHDVNGNEPALIVPFSNDSNLRASHFSNDINLRASRERHGPGKHLRR